MRRLNSLSYSHISVFFEREIPWSWKDQSLRQAKTNTLFEWYIQKNIPIRSLRGISETEMWPNTVLNHKIVVTTIIISVFPILTDFTYVSSEAVITYIKDGLWIRLGFPFWNIPFSGYMPMSTNGKQADGHFVNKIMRGLFGWLRILWINRLILNQKGANHETIHYSWLWRCWRSRHAETSWYKKTGTNPEAIPWRRRRSYSTWRPNYSI
jgi:hypothetical protein